jgi:hypothetical protein
VLCEKMNGDPRKTTIRVNAIPATEGSKITKEPKIIRGITNENHKKHHFITWEHWARPNTNISGQQLLNNESFNSGL